MEIFKGQLFRKLTELLSPQYQRYCNMADNITDAQHKSISISRSQQHPEIGC
jgi:hypothetical protein